MKKLNITAARERERERERERVKLNFSLKCNYNLNNRNDDLSLNERNFELNLRQNLTQNFGGNLAKNSINLRNSSNLSQNLAQNSQAPNFRGLLHKPRNCSKEAKSAIISNFSAFVKSRNKINLASFGENLTQNLTKNFGENLAKNSINLRNSLNSRDNSKQIPLNLHKNSKQNSINSLNSSKILSKDSKQNLSQNPKQNSLNSNKNSSKNATPSLREQGFIWAILAFVLLPNTAFAYLDPASGSLLLSSIVAIFASILFTLKNLFYRFGSLGVAFKSIFANFKNGEISKPNFANLAKNPSFFSRSNSFTISDFNAKNTEFPYIFTAAKNEDFNATNLAANSTKNDGEILANSQINSQPKSLVFYSEGRQYYLTFKPILELLDALNHPYLYLTSDENDPALKAHLNAEFIGSGNKAYARLNFLKADILVMTTPGLNVLHIKRSRGVRHYCHIVHSLTPMTYHSFGIDYFDSVLLVNEIQASFVREVEAAHKMPQKALFITGLTYLDELFKLYKNAPKSDKSTPTILICPSWGKESLLTKYGAKLLLAAAQTGYTLIIRPHPQSLISPSERENIELLKTQLKNFANVEWDIGTANVFAFKRTDLLIGDFSSSIFDFVCLTQKPIITLDFSFDPAGYDVADIDLKGFYTFKTLEKISIKLKESEFDDLKNIIDNALKSTKFKENLKQVAKELWLNPQNSNKACVSVILNIQKALLEQNLSGFTEQISRLKFIDDALLALKKDEK